MVRKFNRNLRPTTLHGWDFSLKQDISADLKGDGETQELRENIFPDKASMVFSVATQISP